MKSLKGLLLVGAAAAAILVPLYGDPRRSPVTHPEWAHMLLRALDMESVLVAGSGASLAFDSLSWRTTVGVAPDKPFRKMSVDFVEGPPRLVRAIGNHPGELGYRLAIARRGDYRIRAKLGGDLRSLLGLELTREGETTPVRSITLAAAVLTDSGAVPLTPGVYTLSVALPPGLTLEAIEVVPPCLNSIEPPGGWQPSTVALTGDVAVTVLKATDLEGELPPAAAAIEVPAMAFQPTTARALKASLRGDLEGFWLRAGAEGLEAIVHVDIPEPGLYAVSAYGVSGGGQSWLVDSCLKAVLCPKTEPETPRWIPLLTAAFSTGRHSFAVTLANDAGLQRLKIERKKDSVADYLATLARLGLDLGDQRPIPRPLAVEAMDFVRTKRRAALSKCDDVFLPGALVAGLALPGGAAITSGQNLPIPGSGGAPLVPLPGPSAPTPTVSPSPGPGPSPASPSPAPNATSSPGPTSSPSPSPSPSPSIGPPPTTLVQPPASPVKD